jgi:hypothetical protein
MQKSVRDEAETALDFANPLGDDRRAPNGVFPVFLGPDPGQNRGRLSIVSLFA